MKYVPQQSISHEEFTKALHMQTQISMGHKFRKLAIFTDSYLDMGCKKKKEESPLNIEYYSKRISSASALALSFTILLQSELSYP